MTLQKDEERTKAKALRKSTEAGKTERSKRSKRKEAGASGKEDTS